MAGGRIRGITIELGGDSKGLVKSLQNAQKSTKEVSSALKDVNKVLKLDPKNTELLAQKQKLLGENVDAVRAQLEQEKQALEALKNADNSEETVKQQEALERQIVETTAALDKAEKELKEFNEAGQKETPKIKSKFEELGKSLSAVGEKLKEVGGKITAVGEEMTKKVTAPILAVGGAAVAAFNQVDQGLDIIIQKTGATGEALEGMEEVYENLGKTIPASFEEIGTAVGEVNTRFGITGQQLEEVSGLFLKFAQLNGQDVNSAIDQTQKALAAYGLGAESAGAYLDAMNKVAQNTGVSVDKLQTGIVANATAFQELGLSLEQSTVLMGDLEKSGADSQTVLNGLRKALKNATAEGIPLDTALANLQDTILNGEGAMDGLTAAYDLFGKSGDQIYSAVRNGALDFSALGSAALNAGGSVSDTFEATLDPTDRFKLSLQAAQLAAADLGAVILDVLAPMIDKLRAGIEIISQKWQELSPQTQEAIVKTALIVAAIGPVLVIIGKIISMVGTLLTIIPKIGAVIGLITSPVGLVVAAFAALVAAGIAVYKNWDVIKEKAVAIWTTLKDWFTKTIEALKEFFSRTFGAIRDAVVNSWTALKERAIAIWTTLKDWFFNVLNWFKEKFAIFGVIRDAVIQKWQSLKERTLAIWTSIKEWLANKVDSIRTKFSNVWNSIYTTASNIFQNIKTAVTTPVEKAKELLSTAIEKIKGFFNFDSIFSSVSNIFENIKNAITNPIETAKNLVDSAINWIKGLFPFSIGRIFSNISLPHFHITGGEFPYGIMGRGSLPRFSIDWYKKAMNRGMILNSPTIFGFSNGKFLAGGDAGSEAVVGTSSLMGMIQQATRNAGGLDAERIYEAVRQGASDATIKTFLSGRDVTDSVSQELTNINNFNARFMGA